MNEFEMCKAIAELEGFEIVQQKTGGWFAATAHNKTVFDYNPITDLALNCELRDRYKVAVSYDYVESYALCEIDICLHYTAATTKQDIPRAVIECILKSEGLWK